MNPETRLTIKSSAVAEPAGEDQLVLDLGSGRYFALGEVGGFVWARLDGRRTLGEIAREIAGAYEIAAEHAVEDVLAFAADLVAADLAEAAPPGAAEGHAPQPAAGRKPAAG